MLSKEAQISKVTYLYLLFLHVRRCGKGQSGVVKEEEVYYSFCLIIYFVPYLPALEAEAPQ